MATTAPSRERATRGMTSTNVLGFVKTPKQLLIGGKWASAKSGKTFETINPANEEVLAVVADGDKADVDEAVRAARGKNAIDLYTQVKSVYMKLQ